MEGLSDAVTSDRMRKLFCAGYCRVFVPSLAGPNLYALTPKGRDLVADALELDPAELRVVTTLPKRLDHLLAIGEQRIHLAVAIKRSTRYDLASFRSDHDLAGPRHRSGTDLVPDALVEIDNTETNARTTLAWEIDLGSESCSYIVQKKLARYVAHAHARVALYGALDPIVLFVAHSTRRARNIARLMKAHGVEGRIAFAVRDALDETNILGARYALPRELAETADDRTASACFRHTLLG
ncbi:MAG: replication-relaxation family protein [Myxococcales bacterium]|nr:replication-relaxation family protein [Myxococcales bacterium]